MGQDLRSMTILTAFVRAHVAGQHKLLDYFGDDGMSQSCEQARCIIESQTAVYRAVTLAASRAAKVSSTILAGLNTLRESSHVVDTLSKFICEAHRVGVLNGREADALLRPLMAHSRVWAAHM